MNYRKQILVISDLHGHCQLLKHAIQHGLASAGRDDLDVVLLGDYVDNGPEVPELLAYLADGSIHNDFPRIKLHCILGNHDLACILAYNPGEFNNQCNIDWWQRWVQTFQMDHGRTAEQYGASTQSEFQRLFPQHHYNFLVSLPWYVQIAQYTFVHAGLRLSKDESVADQLSFLDSKNIGDLSKHTYGRSAPYGLPDQLCHKGWKDTNDPSWNTVVVTGHNKYKPFRDYIDFVDSHRIGFHSAACALQRPDCGHRLSLHCGLLPVVDEGGSISVFDNSPCFFGIRRDGLVVTDYLAV